MEKQRNQKGIKELVTHWLKFNLVGVVGMVVQTAVLALFNSFFGIRASLAFVCAVEIAVIHNFFWHEKWTWSDRPSLNDRQRWARFLQFNATNGVVSLLGAVIFMEMLHEWCHLPVQLVNLISIVACSLINFALSNSVVFRKPKETLLKHP